MRRRELLRAGGLVGIGLLAGCTGSADPGSRSDAPGPPQAPETPDNVDSGSYRIETYDYNAGEEGPLVVSVTVENTGSGTPDATLRASVEVTDGSDRQSQPLDVPPGDSRTYDLTFDLSVERFEEQGSLSLRIA